MSAMACLFSKERDEGFAATPVGPENDIMLIFVDWAVVECR